jgi:RNA polymerase sigma-70 factor, ECF subfamily
VRPSSNGAAGDAERQARFTTLYRAYYGAIVGYAARRTDPATARDVAAETFLVAWRRLASVPAEPGAAPWLYGVARRVLANTERSRGRTERTAAKLLTEPEIADRIPDPADGIGERDRILRALGQLSAVDQEVLRLIGWEDLDLAGAAQVMGCSRAHMAVRLHRARIRMAKALQAVEQADPAEAIGPRQESVVEETR